MIGDLLNMILLVLHVKIQLLKPKKKFINVPYTLTSINFHFFLLLLDAFQGVECHQVLTLQFPLTLLSEVYHPLLSTERLTVIGFDHACHFP